MAACAQLCEEVRGAMADGSGTLSIVWSPVYRPEWDDAPEEYVASGIVCRGRSRRLARAEDPTRRFKAYLGVQHFDPARYGLAGEAQAKFFVSLFVAGRTISLRTFSTLHEAREALERFWSRLADR